MAHPFFLSYARDDSKWRDNPEPGSDPYFKLFVNRLNQRVRQLTGSIGFFDRSSINAGDDWSDELAESLRTSKTIVCLYSPTYFLSDYCGKEMQVLLERRHEYVRVNGGKKPANIIPVLWHSTRRRIPKTLPNIQYEVPDLDPNKHGAWDLGDMDRLKDLEKFADEIALRVRDAADETPLPLLSWRPRIDAVRSAFLPPPLPLPEFDAPEASGEGPDAVTFIYARTAHWRTWPWAPPEEQAVLHLAASVAKGKEMESTQLTFELQTGDLYDRLSVLRSKNNVAVLLLDETSLNTDTFRICIHEFDKPEYSTFSTIVIAKTSPEPEIRVKLDKVLPFFSRRNPPYLFVVKERERFADVIAEALDGLRLATVRNPSMLAQVLPAGGFPSLPGIRGPGPA
jgi:hypothetical protein